MWNLPTPASLRAVLAILAVLCPGHLSPVRAADESRAEIKLLVRSDAIAEAKAALALPAAAQKTYRIYFVDTPDLDFEKAGLILRLRDKQHGTTEVTLKIRPKAPAQFHAERWEKLEKETEWVAGRGENMSYATKEERAGADLLEDPAVHLAQFFSDEHKALIREITGHEFEPAQMKIFGPIEAQIWEWNEAALQDEISAELWKCGNLEIFELSRKTGLKNLATKGDDFVRILAAKGVAADPAPESKTHLALKYFSTHP